MKGFIAFEGQSLFDKKPIVGIVTLNSANPKTGNMAQLWIIRSDIDPVSVVKQKQDQSICGGCKHRHNLGGSCYVQPFQAPRSVYNSYKKGNYSRDMDRGLLFLSNLGLRLGAYGDPAMLPYEILKKLTDNCRFYTGYTHQWKNKKLRHALEFCQGSTDNLKEYHDLKTIDPRAKSFRVVTDETQLLDDEIICLADSQNLSCIECKLCDGSKKDIVIAVHGQRKKRFNDQIPIINLN